MFLKKLNAVYVIVVLLVLANFAGCEEKDEQEAKVLTEELLYVSGNTARLVGRILVLPNGVVNSYGFLISESENFENSIRIEIPEEGKLGRFIGETSVLESGNTYYGTTFMIVDGNQILGNTILFNSLEPSISDFSPKIAKPGSSVVIEGANFTGETKVFFGDVEGRVTKVDFESRITVTVPEGSGQINVQVRVVDGEIEITSDQVFEYVSGKWELQTSFFNTNHFNEALSFTSSGNLYYGLGVDEDRQLNPNVWSMNLNTFEWANVPFQAFHRDPFSAGGYFGGGAVTFFPKNFSSDFYFFDGISFNPLSSSPFRLNQSIAFNLDDQVIVLGGTKTTSAENFTMYSYSKADDSWSVLGDTPFIVQAEAPHFEYENNLYVFNVNDGFIWLYETEVNRWSKIVAVPKNLGSGGIAAVLGNKIFVGLFRFSNEIWELDLNTLQWKEKIAYPNSKGDINSGFYVHDDKIFVLKNPFVGGSTQTEKMPMQIWSFDPDSQ